jgi:hypothetical protein
MNSDFSKKWRIPLNCYIVRIYREGAANPREFVGVVEEVGTDGKRAFTNIDELWEILKPGRTEENRNGDEKG